MSMPYYCHQCSRTVNAEADRSLRCSRCHGEFIEEIHINEGNFEPEDHDGSDTQLDGGDFLRMIFGSSSRGGPTNSTGPNRGATSSGNPSSSQRQSQFAPTSLINNLLSNLMSSSSSSSSQQPSGTPTPGNNQNRQENFTEFLNQLVANLSANAPPGATFQFQFNGSPIHGDVNNYVFGEGSFDQLISQLLNNVEPQQQGLSQEDLNCLPKAKISQEQVDNGVQCTTCMETFNLGEEVIKLPDCSHVFHEGCIFPWLVKNRTCPICRHEIEPQGKKKPEKSEFADIDELD